MNYFITGIGTDVGKTVVSAILTHALQADYWKPVQCGFPRDTDTVRSLVNNNHSLFYKEAYLLKAPVSPHQAAEMEDVSIDLDKIILPDTNSNTLIIEGAGGILVPLNNREFIIDLTEKFKSEIILVCNLYLGSINHTLLTIQELKRRGLRVKGIVFNGPDNPYSRKFITGNSGIKPLLHIKPEKKIDQTMVTRYAIELFELWDQA